MTNLSLNFSLPQSLFRYRCQFDILPSRRHEHPPKKFKIIHNYIPQKYTITLTHISYENDLSCDYSMSYINAFYISYQPIRISAQLRFALYDITKYLTQPCEMNYIDTNIPTFPRINSVDEFNQQIHLFIKRYMQKNTQSHLHIVYNYYPYKYHGHNLDTYYIRFTCLN